MNAKLLSLLGVFVQTLFGLAVVVFAGDMLHDEVMRPGRSVGVMVGSALALILGTLIVPGASPIVVDKSKTLFALVQNGRRATDVKLAEIEIPPKTDA